MDAKMEILMETFVKQLEAFPVDAKGKKKLQTAVMNLFSVS